jgi:hypothetical protein
VGRSWSLACGRVRWRLGSWAILEGLPEVNSGVYEADGRTHMVINGTKVCTCEED